jgi:hypothetical protein
MGAGNRRYPNTVCPKARLEEFSEKQQDAISKELAYLENNPHRMDYKSGADAGQPVGSATIGSTC